jgi:hypothetical protein
VVPRKGIDEVSHPPRAVDLLELTPVRRALWLEREDGRVVIDRPRPTIDSLGGLFRCAGWLLSPRRIRLDEIGSFAWRRLDGSTKVRSLAGAVRDAFPDSCDQLEERLGAHLRAMRRLRLISFAEWNEPGT